MSGSYEELLREFDRESVRVFVLRWHFILFSTLWLTDLIWVFLTPISNPWMFPARTKLFFSDIQFVQANISWQIIFAHSFRSYLCRQRPPNFFTVFSRVNTSFVFVLVYCELCCTLVLSIFPPLVSAISISSLVIKGTQKSEDRVHIDYVFICVELTLNRSRWYTLHLPLKRLLLLRLKEISTVGMWVLQER